MKEKYFWKFGRKKFKPGDSQATGLGKYSYTPSKNSSSIKDRMNDKVQGLGVNLSPGVDLLSKNMEALIIQIEILSISKNANDCKTLMARNLMSRWQQYYSSDNQSLIQTQDTGNMEVEAATFDKAEKVSGFDLEYNHEQSTSKSNRQNTTAGSQGGKSSQTDKWSQNNRKQ